MQLWYTAAPLREEYYYDNPIKMDRITLPFFPVLRAGLLSVAVLSLPACGFTGAEPTAASADVYDPVEPTNRAVFSANQFIDRNALRPISRAYRDNVPVELRTAVGNFSSNLREPVTLVNDLLQGNTARAWTTTQRFVVNSTVGVGGLLDVGTDLDLPRHAADFGQTLGVWGVGPGPAVQLPLLGPSNTRDTVGTVVTLLANPLSFIPGGVITGVVAGGTGAGVVDGRANLLETTDALEASSLDYYASLRSAQAQRRAALVQEGRRGAVGRRRGASAPQQALATPTSPVSP